MQGLAGAACELGMPHAFAAHAPATLVVRDHHIRFLREARVAAALAMTATVVEMDEAEATIALVMAHASGETAVTFTTRVAHVSAREGRPFPWPARAREAGERMRGPLPPEAAPRSLIAPIAERPTLAEADRLGLQVIGRSVVTPADLDVFGRLRTELFIGRISDGIEFAVSPLRKEAQAAAGPDVRVGGAALEYRLRYFEHPLAGEHVVVRSGLQSVEPKIAVLRHWLIDPLSGQAWGAAEHVSTSFDLDARRMIPLPDEAVARLRGGSGRA
jgi:acyl-CoA thioester hydrolase